MFGTVVDFVNANQALLSTAAAFITGACLLHLVISRTLRKRSAETDETSA